MQQAEQNRARNAAANDANNNPFGILPVDLEGPKIDPIPMPTLNIAGEPQPDVSQPSDPVQKLNEVNPQNMTASADTLSRKLADIANTLGAPSVNVAQGPTQNMDSREASAYAVAFAQQGDEGAARDAALAAGIAEKVTTLRAQIVAGSISDPNGTLSQQLNVATDALMSKDAYYRDANNHVGLVDPSGNALLLPDGVSRLTTNAQLAPLNITEKMLFPNDGSGFQAGAYYDANRSTYIIADKGTANGKDWLNDFQQGVGLYSQQYDDAALIARRVAVSNAAKNIEYTGHSLGGGLASLQSLISNAPAVTFNAAGLTLQTAVHYHVSMNYLAQKINPTDQIRAYYVQGDPLSEIQDHSVLASALGASIPLAPDNPVQFTGVGLKPSTPMSGWQVFKSSITGNLHFMGSVESSIYSNFSVFK